MIRVIIAEDHLMVREGIRAMLERTGDMNILGEASNGHEAVEMTKELMPDVLIMDIMMPRMNGIQAAETIRDLKIPVNILLLSMHSDPELIYQALNCGAKGYVLKSSVGDELLLAVRTVANRQRYLSSPVSEIIIERAVKFGFNKKEDTPLSYLSPREKEIMQLIAEGHTNSEIAELLGISGKTVEKHRANLMNKMGARNLAGLVRLAVKYRLVDRDS